MSQVQIWPDHIGTILRQTWSALWFSHTELYHVLDKILPHIQCCVCRSDLFFRLFLPEFLLLHIFPYKRSSFLQRKKRSMQLWCFLLQLLYGGGSVRWWAHCFHPSALLERRAINSFYIPEQFLYFCKNCKPPETNVKCVILGYINPLWLTDSCNTL